MAKFVEEQVFDYEEILSEVEYYRSVKEKIADNVTLVCSCIDTPYISMYDINMNHDNFKIFRVPGRIFLSEYVAIFNMNKIVRNGYITLKVPSRIVGYVIGKEGCNIKAWAREVGVKKIQVVPI